MTWSHSVTDRHLVRIERTRRLDPHGLTEELRLASTASAPVRATISVDLGCDLAPVELVKSGGAPPALDA